VYGEFANGDESPSTNPFSPYGVTKLAAENLITAYRNNFGISATILRYFSVFGPSQRPDMAYSKFIDSLLLNREIEIFGDGEQRRSNTFISDVVEATKLSADPRFNGEIFNICGDESITINEAIEALAESLGIKPIVRHLPVALGDQRDTSGDNSKAKRVLGWTPKVSIREGLEIQARQAQMLYEHE
jgi:UDP-glucose 4-epimerase